MRIVYFIILFSFVCNYAKNQGLTNSLANISHENLLDNPWFTVNQRGQSSYTANNAYCVDRWKTVGTSTDKEVKKVSNGLELKQNSSSSGAWNAIEQFIEHDDLIIGERYTISILYADGTIRSKVSLPLAETTSYTRFAYTNMYQDVVVNFDYQGNGGFFLIDIETKNSTVVDTVIRAVKLEKGTVSTLAMDTAPNYQQELAKCQRYFQRIKSNQNGMQAFYTIATSSSSLRGLLILQENMRNKPTITISDITGITLYNSGTPKQVNSLAIENIDANNRYVKLTMGSSNVAINEVYAAEIANGVYIDFSADL